MQYAYLENTSGGHNKFYEMEENPGGKTWKASWGAIGKSSQTKDYPMSDWWKKHDEKLKKGYVDKTHLKNPPKPKKPPFVVDKEHLERVNKVMLVLSAHSSMIANSAELIRDVSAVRAMLKDPKSKGKGKLEADDMIFLNDVWKKIKHYAKKN